MIRRWGNEQCLAPLLLHVIVSQCYEMLKGEEKKKSTANLATQPFMMSVSRKPKLTCYSVKLTSDDPFLCPPKTPHSSRRQPQH